MSKAQENTLIFVALLAAGMTGLGAYLAQRTGMMVFHTLLPFYLIVSAISALTALRLRMARLSEEERLDLEGARAKGMDTSIFSNASEEGAAPFTLARSREQFERFVMPVLCPVVILVMAVWGLKLCQRIELAVRPGDEGLLATSFLIGMGFILFLVSRYLVGVSRQAGLRLCRGPGIDTALASLVSFGAAASALLAVWFGATSDRIAAWIIAGLLLLLAVEKLIFYIAAWYHPRRRRMLGLALESRLGHLVADPGAWAGSVAHTVDYQFGVDVSENWYRRLLKRTLVPMLGALAAVVYALSCFVFLGPHEEGLLEHFGKPANNGAVLQPGLHVKLPWPFQTMRRVPAKRLLTTYLGFIPKEDDPHPKVVQWTVPHYAQEDLVLIAAEQIMTNANDSVHTPVSLMTMNIPIQYRITNAFQFVYTVAEPEAAFDLIARRALAQQMAGLDHRAFAEELARQDGGRLPEHRTEVDLLTAGRGLIARRLQETIQRESDRMQLGIEVVFVGLQGLHPPTAVAGSYQNVVGALEQKESAILYAEAYAASVLPRAEAEAEEMREQARSAGAERVGQAEAEAIRFEQHLLADRVSPQVFRLRTYLDHYEESLKGVRKYVVSSAFTNVVHIVDFEETILPSFADPSLLEEESP